MEQNGLGVVDLGRIGRSFLSMSYGGAYLYLRGNNKQYSNSGRK